MYKNITLKLNARVLARARALASEEDSSLSAWVNRLIKCEIKKRDDSFASRKTAPTALAKVCPSDEGQLRREATKRRNAVRKNEALMKRLAHVRVRGGWTREKMNERR